MIKAFQRMLGSKLSGKVSATMQHHLGRTGQSEQAGQGLQVMRLSRLFDGMWSDLSRSDLSMHMSRIPTTSHGSEDGRLKTGPSPFPRSCSVDIGFLSGTPRDL